MLCYTVQSTVEASKDLLKLDRDKIRVMLNGDPELRGELVARVEFEMGPGEFKNKLPVDVAEIVPRLASFGNCFIIKCCFQLRVGFSLLRRLSLLCSDVSDF